MAIWSKQSKNTATYSNLSKNSSIWDTQGLDLLLLSNGYLLLLSNSTGTVDNKIILGNSSVRDNETSWSNQTKN